jgi:1,4-alpha-glucan branching enzyme
VALAGTFNHWNPEGYDLQSPTTGLWQISIPSLPTGIYRYKFIIDDRWVDDPENTNREQDGYGGFTSLLEV